MSDRTHVRKAMASDVREQQKLTERQTKAFAKAPVADVNALNRKDPDRRGPSANQAANTTDR